MESKNIFNLNEEDGQSQLSAKPEGQFFNPEDDASVSTSNGMAEDSVPATDELVGSDGKVTDGDSSLTVDTDAIENATDDDSAGDVDPDERNSVTGG